MTLTSDSSNYVSLDMIPLESQYGETVTIVVTGTLVQTTPLSNSSYTFDLTFTAPVIVPPSVTSPDIYCDP
jgi:hypothetical protein